jgi:2-oxo-4-hydroxy-4-carboxy-5-ureidoimidazoline decarboxylase
MTIGDLNGKGREDFTDAIGSAFEQSPWVACRGWEKRPFASLDELHAALTSVVDAASADEQLALLRAHPDLGTRAGMSTASEQEQTRAGLTGLSYDDRDRLATLNAAYTKKFGFPFIYAVKGATKQDILDALNRRLGSSREDEVAEALRQVYRIARFRLEAVIS